MIDLQQLVIFRHGRSLHNNTNWLLLSPDVEISPQRYLELTSHCASTPDDQWELTDRGRGQARFVSEIFQVYLRDHGIVPDAHYSSPYSRAWETAHLVLPNAKWVRAPALRERNWGNTTANCATVEEFRRYHPEATKQCDTRIDYIPGEGGESVADTLQETLEFLQLLAHQHPGGTVVCSGHGEKAKIIRFLLMGGDPEAWPAICKHTGLSNLSFLHFRKGSSGVLEEVRRLNPFHSPMGDSGWQPLDPRHIVSA